MTSNTNRKGSAERSIVHTRIVDDNHIKDTYLVGRKLGEGSFGKVHEGIHRETNKKWAIKSINKEKAGTTGLKLMEREVSILKRVHHPNIIQLNEVIESPKHMFLVMEICEGGELADALRRKNYYQEGDAKMIMARLSSAISYLHKNDIVHRDIKLENILLSQNPEDENDMLHIKVTDFGLSVVKGGQGHDNMMQDFCGTPMYMAPEIIENKTYSQQCDVWAMGVIAYILLCGNPPFLAKDDGSLSDLIKKGDIDFTTEVWNPVSVEAKKCIQGMLKVDPAHRLSAAEVVNNPWFTGEARDESEPANVLEMMKSWGPELKKEGSSEESDISAINGDDEDKKSFTTTPVSSSEENLSKEAITSVLMLESKSSNLGSGGIEKPNENRTPPTSSTRLTALLSPEPVSSRKGSGSSLKQNANRSQPASSTKLTVGPSMQCRPYRSALCFAHQALLSPESVPFRKGSGGTLKPSDNRTPTTSSTKLTGSRTNIKTSGCSLKTGVPCVPSTRSATTVRSNNSLKAPKTKKK